MIKESTYNIWKPKILEYEREIRKKETRLAKEKKEAARKIEANRIAKICEKVRMHYFAHEFIRILKLKKDT
jgi:hypothetical protein